MRRGNALETMTTITRGRDIAHAHPPADTPQLHRNLDSRWHAVLDGRHEYLSDHAALTALALAAIAARWTFTEWELWVTADPLRGLTATYVLREEKRKGRSAPRSDSRRRRLLARTWQAATDYAQDRPAFADPFAVRAWVTDLRRLSYSDAWGGQAGNSDRLTLDALLDLAGVQRSTLVTASARDLADATGIGRTTVSRALKRLARRGYLSTAQESRGEDASRYQLRRPNRYLGGTPSLPDKGDDPRVPPTTLSRSDAFAPRALGRSAARVLAALDPLQDLTAAEVAQGLGLTPRTVRKALDALLAAGLVVRLRRDGRTWSWAARDDLDLDVTLAEVAEAYGTTGTAERRLQAHDLQREGWRAWLGLHPRATYQTAPESWRSRKAVALADASRRGQERARRRPPLLPHGERRTA
jgi:DNA-binding MarR family transcriptional regulator